MSRRYPIKSLWVGGFLSGLNVPPVDGETNMGSDRKLRQAATCSNTCFVRLFMQHEFTFKSAKATVYIQINEVNEEIVPENKENVRMC